MIASEIAALPDRELDALVAEKVMGWKPKNGGGFHQFQPFYTREWTVAAWQPSTDPRAMMEVLERMRGAHVFQSRDYAGKYVACFEPRGGCVFMRYAAAQTLPRAVAEAALLAAMSKENANAED